MMTHAQPKMHVPVLLSLEPKDDWMFLAMVSDHFNNRTQHELCQWNDMTSHSEITKVNDGNNAWLMTMACAQHAHANL